MRLLQSNKGCYSFLIEDEERELLFKVLELYPLIPASYQPLSKFEDRPEDQKLLEESLAAQRKTYKRQVRNWMKSKTVFTEREDGWQFTLKAGQVEWLLQVLNDVHLGSWLMLGSPYEQEKALAQVTPEKAPFVWTIRLARIFQMAFIHAIEMPAAESEI